MKISGSKFDVWKMVQDLWSLFSRDSLFRNSVYLMLSTGVMAVFGFIFWIITTHYYNSEEIGFATALISITVLISTLSLLGFNSSLIRYLVKSEHPNRMINTAMAAVSLSTAVISVIYLLGIDYFAPAYHVLGENPLYASLFVLFMVAVSLNTLTDSVFVAHRLSKYNLIVYTFFGLTKISLPLLLISLGSYGIFFSYTGAIIVALFLSVYFMMRHFAYRPELLIDGPSARQMLHFSLSNYAVGFISGVPALLSPVLIVNELGAKASAYFYMASTIAALLYIIPNAIAQSLFAEGSFSEQEFASFVKRAVRLIAVFLLPAILVVLVFGNYLLLVFGAEYSQNSFYLLQIMALSSVFLSINNIGSTTLRIRHRMRRLLFFNLLYLSFSMLLFYLLLERGTVGITWALLLGQAFLSGCFLFAYRRRLLDLLVR